MSVEAPWTSPCIAGYPMDGGLHGGNPHSLWRLTALAALIVLEATGAGVLWSGRGVPAPVVVVNPRQVRTSRSDGRLAKTDTLDAAVSPTSQQRCSPPCGRPDAAPKGWPRGHPARNSWTCSPPNGIASAVRRVLRKELQAHIRWLERRIAGSTRSWSTHPHEPRLARPGDRSGACRHRADRRAAAPRAAARIGPGPETLATLVGVARHRTRLFRGRRKVGVAGGGAGRAVHGTFAGALQPRAPPFYQRLRRRQAPKVPHRCIAQALTFSTRYSNTSGAGTGLCPNALRIRLTSNTVAHSAGTHPKDGGPLASDLLSSLQERESFGILLKERGWDKRGAKGSRAALHPSRPGRQNRLTPGGRHGIRSVNASRWVSRSRAGG